MFDALDGLRYNQAMLTKIVTYLRESPTARIIAVFGLIVAGFYAARLYYVDVPKIEEKAASQAGAARLDAMADALEARIGTSGAELSKTLPRRTPWHPANLPCGAEIAFGATHEPIWNSLGIDAAQTTAFQYRFEYHDDRFVLLARRDSDCDGLHGVWRLEGRTDWSALLGRTTSAQNASE